MNKIKEIILSNQTDEFIRGELSNYHENDIAAVLPELDRRSRKNLYRALGMETSAEILSYLEDASAYLEELDIEEAADVLEEMDADDAVDILEHVSEDFREELISHMDEEAGREIRLISSYDGDEIGSRMTTNYILIHKSCSIRQAMKALITQAEEHDNINTIYVEDDTGAYYGAIDLKELITARDYEPLETIISTSYPAVHGTAKVQDCIEWLRSYEEDSIPVLNDSNNIIGVITLADIIEAVDDEMSDDYAKLAGLTTGEDLNESLTQSLKKRLPWLILLLFLGIGVSSVVGIFEGLVSQIALIVCFQSLILDMSGNVGTQSLAVTIRVLMDEAISKKQRTAFICKELRIGLLNGLLLGSFAFLFIGAYVWLAKGKTLPYAFAISGCVGISLLVAMLISSLVGTLVPMFFQRLKVDPAVASGPLITTINDLVAVITYYGLSGIILIQLLHLV